jgi:hypothetical protein
LALRAGLTTGLPFRGWEAAGLTSEEFALPQLPDNENLGRERPESNRRLEKISPEFRHAHNNEDAAQTS